MIEVAIPRAQCEVVLEHESRYPEVVDRDRGSLTAKLAEEGGVVVSRLLVREERCDAGLPEERPQGPLVLGATPAEREAGPQLGDDHEGQEDGSRVADQLHDLGQAAAQVRIAVRVEGEPQRQSRRSMRC